MNARRVIVWTISSIFGLIGSVATIIAFDTTLARFTLAGAVLVFISLGSLAFIWLDWILRTDYLKT